MDPYRDIHKGNSFTCARLNPSILMGISQGALLVKLADVTLKFPLHSINCNRFFDVTSMQSLTACGASLGGFLLNSEPQ